MGIGALVNCNCFKEGKYKEPPFPVNLIYIDDEERVDIYGEEDINYKTDKSLGYIFHEWIETACEHEKMHYAYEYLGNWDYYNSFLETLDLLEEFPNLLEHLPTTNSPILDRKNVEPMLNEIESLKKLDDLGYKVFLVRDDNEEKLFRINYGYAFISSQNKYGIYGDALNCEIFILDDNKNEIFRANRFNQKKFNDQFKFTNLENNETCITPCGIFSGTIQAIGETELKQKDNDVDMFLGWYEIGFDYFKDIINSLENLFIASLKTGNNILFF